MNDLENDLSSYLAERVPPPTTADLRRTHATNAETFAAQFEQPDTDEGDPQ